MELPRKAHQHTRLRRVRPIIDPQPLDTNIRRKPAFGKAFR